MTISYPTAPLKLTSRFPSNTEDVWFLAQDVTSMTGNLATTIPTGTVWLVIDPNDFMQLTQKLQETLDEVRELREELAQRPLVSSINLYDLGTDVVKVELPISVVLHETDEEALARWPDVRAHGLGSTLAEAISDLKQNIMKLFLDLHARPSDSLGEIAQATLRTLDTHLRSA